MLHSLHSSLAHFATWPVVALLFVLFLICSQGFEWRRKRLGYETRTLDARFWYSPTDASDFLCGIGPDGRRIYAVTELTLDILFPLVYGSLFAALIIQVYAPERGKFLLLVPLLAAVFDVLENITTAYLAWQYDGRTSPIARGAAVFTATKSALLLLSLILIVIGAVISASRIYRSRT
jgi:hypothetical protein